MTRAKSTRSGTALTISYLSLSIGKKALYGEVRQKLTSIIKSLCRNKGIEIVEGAMCPDHVHISLRIPLKLSVAYVMGYLKGKSALKLFDENPELRRRTEKGRTLWVRGYYVSTVGLDEDVIRKYIREHEEADQFGADS